MTRGKVYPRTDVAIQNLMGRRVKIDVLGSRYHDLIGVVEGTYSKGVKVALSGHEGLLGFDFGEFIVLGPIPE